MEEKKEKDFEEIYSAAKTYLDIRMEYMRLFLVKRVTKIFADLVTTTVVIICFGLAFMLGTVTLALFLGSIFNSNTMGFGIVALLYLLLAVVVYLTKDKYIEKAIVNFIIKVYFKKIAEDEEDEQK